MTTQGMKPVSAMLLALVASATMLGFAAAPVQAGIVVVKVSAGELASVNGRASVDARIERAARKACKSDSRELTAAPSYGECVDKALADARIRVAQIANKTQLASR